MKNNITINLKEITYKNHLQELLDLLYLIEDFEQYNCKSISRAIKHLQFWLKSEGE